MQKVFAGHRAGVAARKSRRTARDIGIACAGLLRLAVRRLTLRPPAMGSAEPRAEAQPSGVTAPAAHDHMGKLSTVVDAACRHGERAQACHDSAGRRIDAALYELDQLRQELEAVVDPQLLKRTGEILQGASALAPAALDKSEIKAGPATAERSAA